MYLFNSILSSGDFDASCGSSLGADLNEPPDTATADEERYADLLPAWLDAVKTMASQSEAFGSLNHGEGHALLVLSRTQIGLSAGELAQAMGITSGRMANILRKLEHKGLTLRSAVPQNRRKSSIELTESGKVAAAELRSKIQQRSLTILETLGREDSEALIRILKKLADEKPDS